MINKNSTVQTKYKTFLIKAKNLNFQNIHLINFRASLMIK